MEVWQAIQLHQDGVQIEYSSDSGTTWEDAGPTFHVDHDYRRKDIIYEDDAMYKAEKGGSDGVALYDLASDRFTFFSVAGSMTTNLQEESFTSIGDKIDFS